MAQGNPEAQCDIQKDSSIILSRINPILVLKPISLKSILILSSHLGLPKGLFPVDLPVNILNKD